MGAVLLTAGSLRAGVVFNLVMEGSFCGVMGSEPYTNIAYGGGFDEITKSIPNLKNQTFIRLNIEQSPSDFCRVNNPK